MSDKERRAEGRPANIPYAKQCIDESDIKSVVDALKSDYVTQGLRTEWFEDGLKEVTGAQYAVAVSSGTAALHIACLGLGVAKGDYGITPAITFTASANCLRHVGAEVAFADVDPITGRSSAAHFKKAIEASQRQGVLKALIPVSYSGAVPSIEAIASLALKNKSYVIEDAAHSIGARYMRSDGSLGRSASCQDSDAAILSFHPVKHVCAGEGGAVLTNDGVLASRLRRLRSHGIRKQEDWFYNQEELGFNYRMSELQAALGNSQLGKLKGFIGRRVEIALRYVAAFSRKPFSGHIKIATADECSSYHLFVVHFQCEEVRRAAYEHMHARGIRVQVHYIPVYRHDYYANAVRGGLPGAESFYSTCLSLPMYPSLRVDEQDYVIETIGDFLASCL